MGAICETCSVCGKSFEVQLRWQMEERDGAFAFFCSRPCYENSAKAEESVVCDACGKRFMVELVSQVVALKNSDGNIRRYACGLPCREQLIREANGIRLGEVFAPSAIQASSSESAATTSFFESESKENPIKTDTSTAIHVTRTSTPITTSKASNVATKPPSDHVPKRIAIFNHKGGTGKTTTAVSLSAALAARGKRVLLVDTDSQGNVAASLGIQADKSLYHVLVMGIAPTQAAVSVRPGFDVLPSNETLAAAELYLAGRRERDRVLRDRLASASETYDVVILDCSPSLSLLNQNALVFADALFIPVACDYLSLVGVRQVLKTVKHINQLLHHPVRIGGVIPTMFDARAKICQDALSTLKDHFGPRCLKPIRMNIKLKEAPAYAKTIFEWAADSNAAHDYSEVVDQIWKGIPEDTSGTTRTTTEQTTSKTTVNNASTTQARRAATI